MTNNANILIAGFGYVGSALGEKLSSLGFNVHAIKRSHKTPSGLIKIIEHDLSKPLQLSDLYSTVFYLISADSFTEESYKNAYEVGIRNLLAAFPDNALPERIIFISSSSVYAENNGGWVNESSQTKESEFSAKSLLNGEDIVIKSPIPIPAIVVRFSGIYGPGRTNFKDSILSGQKGLLNSSHFTNRIHRDDCVQSLIYLMQHGKIGEIYNVTDCDPADYNEIVAWLCNKEGIKPSLSVANNTQPIHRSNKRCSNQKLLNLGYKFLYPSYKNGYK